MILENNVKIFLNLFAVVFSELCNLCICAIYVQCGRLSYIGVDCTFWRIHRKFSLISCKVSTFNILNVCS